MRIIIGCTSSTMCLCRAWESSCESCVFSPLSDFWLNWITFLGRLFSNRTTPTPQQSRSSYLSCQFICQLTSEDLEYPPNSVISLSTAGAVALLTTMACIRYRVHWPFCLFGGLLTIIGCSSTFLIVCGRY